MPTEIAENDIIETRVFCFHTARSQVAINTYYYLCMHSAHLPDTLRAWATFFSTLVAPLYRTLMGPDATFYGVSARRYYTGSASLPDTDLAANQGAGGSGLPCLPLQIALLLSFRTETAGHHGVGRVYLPFPGRDQQDATTHEQSDACFGAVDNLGAALIAPLIIGPDPGGTQMKLVVTRRHQPAHHDRVPPKDEVFPDPHVVVSQHHGRGWATVRRRSDFGRLNALPPF